MEKNNKEFNELERKLLRSKSDVDIGKMCLKVGVFFGVFSSLLGYLASKGKIDEIFYAGAATGISMLGSLAVPGLLCYFSGKYKQSKIKKEYYNENTLFPDYFLDYKP